MDGREGHGLRVRRVTMPADSHDVRPLAAALAVALAVALAGCGELETPDLARGNVAGRLVGGQNAQAEIYPLGRPDLAVRPDAQGAFELEGLATGAQTLVVYDGTVRAERIAVVVRGAERERLTLYGDLAVDPPKPRIALGGKVVAAVLPVGGGVAVSPRATVLGTTRRAILGAGGTVVLGVLPAGDYQLTAELDGYGPATRGITVVPGTSVHEVSVAPVTGAAATGCAASGGQCRNGLTCDPASGLCYQCLSDANCSGGASCDPATRFCAAPGGAGAAVCSACTADIQCGDPAGGALCEKAGGAGDEAPAVVGYCTRSDVAVSGPAGFDLRDGPRARRWVAVSGCADYFEEFGEGCFQDGTCGSEGGILGGFCHRADREEGHPGYCTAPCATDLDCVVAGFTCQANPDYDPARHPPARAQVCTRT